MSAAVEDCHYQRPHVVDLIESRERETVHQGTSSASMHYREH